MEKYTVSGPGGLVYARFCLSVFIIISRFGIVVDYVEFPYNLRSDGSGAQT
jgi:hypothetical protein